MTGRLLSLASLAVALAGAIGYFSLLRIPSIRNHFGLALAALGVSVLLAILAMGMRRGLLPVIALAGSALLFGGGIGDGDLLRGRARAVLRWRSVGSG